VEGEASTHRVAEVRRGTGRRVDEEVAASFEVGVGVLRGVAVARRVDRDGAVAFACEAGDQWRPAPSGLGEAVDEDERVAVPRAVLVGVEHGA
jgi:hypothetical protein